MKIKTKFILILSLLIATLVAVTISAKIFLDINEESLNSLRGKKLTVLLNDRDNVVFLDVYLKDIEVALSTREIQILEETELLLKKIATRLEQTAVVLGRDNSKSIEKVLYLIPRTKFFVQTILKDEPASPEVLALAEGLNTLKNEIQKDLTDRKLNSEKDFNNALEEIQHYNEMSATVYPVVIGLFSAIVIVLASLILGTMFSRIEKLRKHFSLSDLDSLQTFDASNMNDELGELVEASNRMLKSFKDSRKQLVDKKFVDSIIEALVDMLVVIDADGKIIRSNKKALADLGLTSNQLDDFQIFQVMTIRNGKDGFQSIKDIRDALVREISVNAEVNFKRSDSSVFPALISGARMEGASGNVAIVISARDMTDMVKAQDDKSEMQKQLVHAARLASLGTLGAGVAHELNNPLVAVRGYAEMISSDKSASTTMRSFADKIVTATDRMQKIIDHLRTFSADTSNRERTPVDINVNLEDSLILLRSQLAVQNVEVETKFDQGLPLVIADSNQLESVFQNLIINARDALGDTTDDRIKMIKIKTSKGPDNSVQIQISDNGNGIPDQVLRLIWDPFFTTKDVGKGTGLGLSIVQGIVKDHQGEIEVRTEIGKGTIFYISFKGSNAVSLAKPVDLFASAKSVHHPASPLERTGNAPRPRCIIIDDEEMVTEILSFYIEQHYDISIFNDSQQAIESFRDVDYDLIITDMKMPGMSGIDVIKHGRQQQPDAKIVVITGHAKTEAEVEEAISLGASLVIPKPFPNRDQIIALLAGVLNVYGDDLKNDNHEVEQAAVTNIVATAAHINVATPFDNPSVLIIDDEVEILEILQLFLSGHFSVTTTAVASEANEFIRSGKFNIIISDMLMPETSGAKILALTTEHSPESRVIIMSGKSGNDPDCMDLLNKGATAVITKPFQGRDSIIASVNRAFSSTNRRNAG